MPSVNETIVRICHALLNEFDMNYKQDTASSVPDGLTSEASKAVKEIAEKIDTALEVAKDDVPPAGDVKDERLGLPVQVDSKGIRGTIVETKQRGWIVVEPTHTLVQDEWLKVAGHTKPMSARWKQCEIIQDTTEAKPLTKEETQTIETFTESDTEINQDAGSYRMTTGIHTGKSIHEIYVDLVDGEVFLKYLAKKTSGLYGDEAKDAAKAYLVSQGIDVE